MLLWLISLQNKESIYLELNQTQFEYNTFAEVLRRRETESDSIQNGFLLKERDGDREREREGEMENTALGYYWKVQVPETQAQFQIQNPVPEQLLVAPIWLLKQLTAVIR
jgi:hypothetical protein